MFLHPSIYIIYSVRILTIFSCLFCPFYFVFHTCTDKLFGTCTQLESPYLPTYKLDNSGLHRLKSTIRYLINSGYAWDDKYAQVRMVYIYTERFQEGMMSPFPFQREKEQKIFEVIHYQKVSILLTCKNQLQQHALFSLLFGNNNPDIFKNGKIHFKGAWFNSSFPF